MSEEIQPGQDHEAKTLKYMLFKREQAAPFFSALKTQMPPDQGYGSERPARLYAEIEEFKDGTAVTVHTQTTTTKLTIFDYGTQHLFFHNNRRDSDTTLIMSNDYVIKKVQKLKRAEHGQVIPDGEPTSTILEGLVREKLIQQMKDIIHTITPHINEVLNPKTPKKPAPYDKDALDAAHIPTHPPLIQIPKYDPNRK